MTGREPIRVLLVDDSTTQREGYRLLLGSQDDITVVAQAGDGAQALGIARRERLDVILMDVQMPRVNGLVATERIRGDAQVRALGRRPRIVLLTAVDLEDYLPSAAVVGAYAILYKDVDPATLFEVVRDAAAAREDDGS